MLLLHTHCLAFCMVLRPLLIDSLPTTSKPSINHGGLSKLWTITRMVGVWVTIVASVVVLKPQRRHSRIVVASQPESASSRVGYNPHRGHCFADLKSTQNHKDAGCPGHDPRSVIVYRCCRSQEWQQSQGWCVSPHAPPPKPQRHRKPPTPKIVKI